MTPYRGGVYSVDDDVTEVEADAEQQREHSQQGYDESDDEQEEVPEEVQPVEESIHHSDLQLEEHLDCDSDGDISDAESFTLKDRQEAINETHPFGIRLWKPALYKKNRSVQKTAEGDIHSTPGQIGGAWVRLFNLAWTLFFGWWLALLAAIGAMACFFLVAAPGSRPYGRVLWGLAGYLFFPFGKVVRLEKDEAYLHEDRGEGRSIFEYEQWQNGDLEYGRLFFGPEPNRSIVGRSRRSIDSSLSETDSLLGHSRTIERRVIFFICFYFFIAPALLLVSLICWLLVYWIPMGKVTALLFSHLRRHPLALSFESGFVAAEAPRSSILLCTYRSVGPRYWKYTVDGTNIILINLMAVVVFVIVDWYVLHGVFHLDSFITSSAFLFPAGLLSIIPLAYFIGQAVASISAQSSMGLGAAINAFFSTVVEVYLYCIALNQGKGRLVEGSIVGSIFAGILFLPGLSMCFGAIKRKTQRFNAKSAGIYGTHELNCTDCIETGDSGMDGSRDCRRCFFSEVPALDDRFYIEAVRPYCYLAAGALFLMYLVGLWFTLRTHAAVIWNSELDEKKQHEEAAAAAAAAAATHAASLRQSVPHSFAETTGTDIRDSHLYQRILGQSLKQVGLSPRQDDFTRQGSSATGGSSTAMASGAVSTPHVVPPKTGGDDGHQHQHQHHHTRVHIPGFSEAENQNLVRQVAEVAATAAVFAARDSRHTRRGTGTVRIGGTTEGSKVGSANAAGPRLSTFPEPDGPPELAVGVDHGGAGGGGGHDAPNWGRTKSAVILLGATVFYAIIAEILVDTVDVVLEGFAVDEKFLGITLFALVPNTTEFLNAISFAMNGNIALSMEIGSAYALQVCMLQIPALVFYSALWPPMDLLAGDDLAHYLFTLLFPQWDMVTTIICVFLLSYMYGEGKSNYFKGSILLLSYVIVVVGFWYSGFTSVQTMGMSRFDTLGTNGEYVSYKTIGRKRSGVAY
ncbi:unnamed protein product [Parascedosporium putredinis]|uniref:Calcium permease n=1 Tax=Parascedosporium putredinis TaxID=1442378 RepID=A0A9P1MDI7_9PEZI|nr:unnamed protein product [Parascedosporium putredinis]CAI7999725.1 unnamed protein product [Parascedosporium putredinis]